MPDIDIESLKAACYEVVSTGDVDKLTDRIIRRTLEKRFDLEEKYLDQSPYKQLLKETATEAVTEIVTNRNITTQNESDRESAAAEESDMSEVFDDEPAAHKRKAPSPSTASKRAKTAPAPVSKSSATTIANLKNYIGKCGVRKVWAKELSGMNGAQQVRHLKELLVELGVEGRPTLDKCRKVRQRREIQAELAEMDTQNIIDEKELAPVEAVRGRRAAARREVKYSLESDEEGDAVSQGEGGRGEEEEEVADSEESEAYTESESEDGDGAEDGFADSNDDEE
ncbi:hypothetical protein DL89DRAFT_149600 [Linderina pennispora]|uniref:DEK C-terminal domain-containing protein n=1 Tax=Linderina pennispora TaxID=61395 RepID=A0A1Y1W8W8_9FUNG|nr:uncharacterized protein DL89DRAFT_149600 [Linderina pennispora]ORX69953.1 hypothetical protein DL89DRAFT_149600 [Linderina pennispora]